MAASERMSERYLVMRSSELEVERRVPKLSPVEDNSTEIVE